MLAAARRSNKRANNQVSAADLARLLSGAYDDGSDGLGGDELGTSPRGLRATDAPALSEEEQERKRRLQEAHEHEAARRLLSNPPSPAPADSPSSEKHEGTQEPWRHGTLMLGPGGALGAFSRSS